jgi:hypothetical protein
MDIVMKEYLLRQELYPDQKSHELPLMLDGQTQFDREQVWVNDVKECPIEERYSILIEVLQ